MSQFGKAGISVVSAPFAVQNKVCDIAIHSKELNTSSRLMLDGDILRFSP